MERWTLDRAVKRFNPNQGRSLKKNNGNLNVRGLTSLIKEMECYYEEVKVEGRGRDRIIITDKKRENKVKKKDMREFNKGQSPSHTKYLALMVMNQVAQVDNSARTINNWSNYFGVISTAEKEIMNGVYNEELVKPYMNHLVELGIIEEHEQRILQDLSYVLKKIAKEQLKTILHQSVKLGLIELVSSWKGKTKNLTKTIDIENEIVNKIKTKEAKMLSDHNISKQYSIMYRNAEKTKAFKSDWIRYLKSVKDTKGNILGLQYIFEVFQIKVLDEDVFIKYLEAHYPEEVENFDFELNSLHYETNLQSYVESFARKKHEKVVGKSQFNYMNEEDKSTLMDWFNITEEDILESDNRITSTGYQDSYEDLVRSERYITSLVSVHNIVHKMSDQQTYELKEKEEMATLQREIYLTELSNPSSVVKNDEVITNKVNDKNNESSLNVVNNSLNKSKVDNTCDDYEISMIRELEDEELVDIRQKIIEYEYHFGNKGIEKMKSDQEMELILGEKYSSITNEKRVTKNDNIIFNQAYIEREKSDDPLADFKRIRSKSLK